MKEGWSKEHVAARRVSSHGDVATGALLSVLSPYTITFWLGVNGMAFAANGSSVHALAIGVFFTGFLPAAMVWGLFLSGVVGGWIGRGEGVVAPDHHAVILLPAKLLTTALCRR